MNNIITKNISLNPKDLLIDLKKVNVYDHLKSDSNINSLANNTNILVYKSLKSKKLNIWFVL